MALDLEGFNELNDINTSETPEDIVQRLRFDESLDIPFHLADADVWSNYCNEELYQLDILVREFLKKTSWKRMRKGQQNAKKKKKAQKFVVPILFETFFGRKPEPKDASVCKKLHQLMMHYCTTYTGETKIAGKKYARAYYFSYYGAKPSQKQPYSLRLRMELNEGKDKNNFIDRCPASGKRNQPHPRSKDYTPSTD